MTKLNELVGQTGTLNYEGLAIDVRVIDYKTSYGIERVQVIPLSGSGTRWINRDKLTLDK